MFQLPSKSKLHAAIDRLYEDMSNESPDSEEYAKMADQLVKLYSLTDKRRISPDVLITTLGNLAGIGVIVGHERANIIVSKAMLFVQKLKS